MNLPVPHIVYWNLRDSVSTPVESKDTPGVVMLAGFSSGLLKYFLENTLDTFTPGSQLENLLSHAVYQRLVVAECDY